MSIKVQFFASLRESIGKSEVALEMETPASIDSVWRAASGGLAMPANTLCAINMEYAQADAAIHDGDEVAFFPPVTGG